MVVRILLYLSTALQFIAAFLAISMLKRTKYIISWILISISFVLMALVRLFDAAAFEKILPQVNVELVNKWLGIVTSFLLLLGVVFIRKIFDFIERIDRLRKDNERKVLNAIIKTEEKERQQFAKDLHDGMGPLLSSAKMSLSSISDVNFSASDKKIISNAKLVIDEAIHSVKEISSHLSPHILTNFGLVRAIKNYAGKINVKVEIESNIEKQRYNQNTEVVLYRVVTELINNTLKHSDANLITINLHGDNSSIIINYFDNGKGFDPDVALNRLQSGMGYDNMYTRLKSISAHMTLTTNMGDGVAVEINAPVKM